MVEGVFFSVCELNASMYAQVLGGLMEVVSLIKRVE